MVTELGKAAERTPLDPPPPHYAGTYHRRRQPYSSFRSQRSPSIFNSSYSRFAEERNLPGNRKMPENPLYQPLAAGQIRLLTILKIEPDIECRLDVHTISELSTLSMKYNALSYVWGSQPASKAIHCNGKPLDITPSLSSTLIEIFAYGTTN
jgi:hypothetical protein